MNHWIFYNNETQFGHYDKRQEIGVIYTNDQFSMEIIKYLDDHSTEKVLVIAKMPALASL